MSGSYQEAQIQSLSSLGVLGIPCGNVQVYRNYAVDDNGSQTLLHVGETSFLKSPLARSQTKQIKSELYRGRTQVSVFFKFLGLFQVPFL